MFSFIKGLKRNESVSPKKFILKIAFTFILIKLIKGSNRMIASSVSNWVTKCLF